MLVDTRCVPGILHWLTWLHAFLALRSSVIVLIVILVLDWRSGENHPTATINEHVHNDVFVDSSLILNGRDEENQMRRT